MALLRVLLLVPVLVLLMALHQQRHPLVAFAAPTSNIFSTQIASNSKATDIILTDSNNFDEIFKDLLSPNQAKQQLNPLDVLITSNTASSNDDILNITETANSIKKQFNNNQNFMHSDKEHVLKMFRKYFSKPRSHDNQSYKEFVREGVILELTKLGFKAFVQKSKFELRPKQPTVDSYNMIGVMPGKYRHTSNDKILLVGAHWDSATKAPGVDDNGSGSVCLLEIARLVALNKCSFEHTIMLVWFDYEETGKHGSEFFVNEYLYPKELDKYNSEFIGAYIMDMILVRDKDNLSQILPKQLTSRLPEFSEEIEREKYKGDFLATWARQTHDGHLESQFRQSWHDLGYEPRTFKALRPVLPNNRLPDSTERVKWSDFFRSDHASFWFPSLITKAVQRALSNKSEIEAVRKRQSQSLNAILLTDLGPWRKSYSSCYHSPCDDEHFLTDNNLSFMQQVVDTLVLSVSRIAQATCVVSLQEPLIPVSSTTATAPMSTTTTTTMPPTPDVVTETTTFQQTISTTTTPSTSTTTPLLETFNNQTTPATSTTTTMQ